MLFHSIQGAGGYSTGAAITFIQSANNQASVTNGSNFTLTLGTAPSQNDLIIVVIAGTSISTNLVTSLAAPSGFTEAAENNTINIYVAYKVAGASEGTSYSFTNNSGGTLTFSGYVAVYRNAAWDTIGVASLANQSVTVSGITVASNNSLLLIYGRSTATGTNFNTPSGFTDLYEESDATAPSIYVGTKSVNSGATGNVTFSNSSGANIRGILFAIKPA